MGHFEDWTEAAHQMLDIRRPAKLDHPWHQQGKNLTSVPHSVYRFYDKILSNPTEASQNLTLLNETIAEDWAVRPNPLNPVEGGKPGLQGLQKITQLFGKVIPDLKFHRKEMFLHQDMVFPSSLVLMPLKWMESHLKLLTWMFVESMKA